MLFKNISEAPGYQYSSSPWNAWKNSIMNSANASLNRNFLQSLGSYDRVLYRGDLAENLGLAYQITKNQAYADKAKEALMNLDLGTVSYETDRSHGLRGYSLAYDWIQPYLSPAEDSAIRDKLAVMVDKVYGELNDNGANLSYVTFSDYHGQAYPAVGMASLALSDYTNPNNLALSSMPADWLKAGTEYYFVNDKLHNLNQSVLFYGFNEATGKSVLGAYKSYVMTEIAYFAQAYSYYYGENLLDKYPSLKRVVLSEVWESLPNLYHNDFVTSGNTKDIYVESFLNLISGEDRANALNFLSNIKAEGSLPLSSYALATDPVIGYSTYRDYSSSPKSFPSYSSYINKDGLYQIFRSGWASDSGWLSLVTWNQRIRSNRGGAHHDQLSFEYYNKGDLIMPDAGEPKHILDNVYGDYETSHNTIAFENPRSPFANSFWSGSSCRGIFKGEGDAASTGVVTPVSYKDVIQTPWMESIDAGARVTTVISGASMTRAGSPWGYFTTLSSPISYERSILFPNKDYFVIIDRMEGTEDWIYRNIFRFGSFSINTTKGPAPYTIGNVNGDMSINGSPYNWLSLSYESETGTGINSSSIKWNTKNPSGTDVYTHLYSVPSSEILMTKGTTRIAGYDYQSEVYAPVVYFRSGTGNNLYRATVLLSRYSNEEERVPSSVPVTGSGNAIKVNASAYQDYIYTGKGVSSFGSFSTNADTAYIRVAGSPTQYTMHNGSYIDYQGSPLISLSKAVDSFSLDKGADKVSFRISGSGQVSITLKGLSGQSYSVTRDGSSYSNFTKSGSDLIISTDLSEHMFEISYTAASDSIPPSAISGLALGAVTKNSAALNWTAPGDDGSAGTASSYDIRYSASPINSSNWGAASEISGEPVPAASGTSQSFVVTGLSENITYYFAIKTSDEAGNVSLLSNVVSGKTSGSAHTAPPVISNTGSSNITSSSAAIIWTTDEPADGSVEYWIASGSHSVLSDASLLTSHSIAVTGLAGGTLYYYKVTSKDSSGNPSSSAQMSFRTLSAVTSGDSTPPAKIEDLSLSNVTAGSVTLNWTAPGDNGSTGTASSYDIRYSASPINSVNWPSINMVSGPVPSASGTRQSQTVSNLNPDTSYYFIIRASDSAGNMSGLSNVPSAKTLSAVSQGTSSPDVAPVSSGGGGGGTLFVPAGSSSGAIPFSTPSITTGKPMNQMSREELIALLLQLLSSRVSVDPCSGIVFSRNLYPGVVGNDVKCLQSILNRDPATQVALKGRGSPGNETSSFGQLTGLAVAKFQEKYAEEILSPSHKASGTGYAGYWTRVKLNQMIGK